MTQKLVVTLGLALTAWSSFAMACDHDCHTSHAGLEVGDRVYTVSGARQDTTAVVIGIESNGQFLLKFDADGAVGTDWDRDSLAKTDGCSEGYCVGESFYVVSGARQDTTAKIVGLQTNHQFVLKFDSDGAVGDSWDKSNLAARQGCSANVCIGQSFYVLSGARQDTTASVVGLENDGHYVLQFDADGAIGDGWNITNLAARTGCSRNFCVNQDIFVTSGARSGTTALIVAVEPNGQLVLKFDADGAVGDGWDVANLVCKP